MLMIRSYADDPSYDSTCFTSDLRPVSLWTCAGIGTGQEELSEYILTGKWMSVANG